jgi:hypothetical protein
VTFVGHWEELEIIKVWPLRRKLKGGAALILWR